MYMSDRRLLASRRAASTAIERGYIQAATSETGDTIFRLGPVPHMEERRSRRGIVDTALSSRRRRQPEALPTIYHE
jgi:hypothetical protein